MSLNQINYLNLIFPLTEILRPKLIIIENLYLKRKLLVGEGLYLFEFKAVDWTLCRNSENLAVWI